MPYSFPEKYKKDFVVFKKLNSPQKIQDFVNKIPINFEPERETCRSPLMVLKNNAAHCMEGAMLAAACFWHNGERPLLLDLKTTKDDDDHVVALFKRNGYWGAVSKTNHAVLRYRDPVFKTVRELALSYFNEYFLDSGVKTMRSFSSPFSLLQYDSDWLVSEKDIWAIPEDLDKSRHFKVFPQRLSKHLRVADKVEIDAGKITDWKKSAQKNKLRG
ncbi:MAG TPA: hypothetical protein VMV71_01695 [Candidatus Paceibacterota bacterium]|nr:hypothetical protein [Candidatus Paceibacterota bacterium]